MSMSMIPVCDAMLFTYLCIYVKYIFYISYSYNYKLCIVSVIIASYTSVDPNPRLYQAPRWIKSLEVKTSS